MSWTKKYWDIVSEFYWVPSYLGLASIPKKHWEVREESVTIPKSMVNMSGPLYRRTRSGDEYWAFVKSREETFNHVFDLVLAILPGDVISELFSPFIQEMPVQTYALQGDEYRNQYAWIGGANVTTPDSFLISPDSLLAIELKFNAKTSLDQLAKYVALLAGEECLNGARRYNDLLYIFPEDAENKFKKQTGIYLNELGPHHVDLLCNSVKNQRVKNFYQVEPDAIKSVLEKLKLGSITWEMLSIRIKKYLNRLGNSQGEETIRRLLMGLNWEIMSHPLSKTGEVPESKEYNQ